MKTITKQTILFIVILSILPACSANKFMFGDNKATVQKTEQADQTVNLALAYHDQGDFGKSAELFMNAADLFKETKNEEMERRTLIAAAKCYLKCSKNQEFQVTVARLKGLTNLKEMPLAEFQFLTNLSDQMLQRQLSYPVQKSWRVVFGY